MAKAKSSTAHKLKDFHRAFIVRELACYATPTEIVETMRQDFGITITPQTAQHYDPGSVAGRTLAKKWKAVFDEVRAAARKDMTEHLPLTNRVARIRKLSKAAAYFEGVKNYIAMADMLERIAKECGNIHSNVRQHQHTGANGGPIQTEDVTPPMTRAELEAECFRMLGMDSASVMEAPETEQ